MMEFDANFDRLDALAKAINSYGDAAIEPTRKMFGDIGQQFKQVHQRDRLKGRPGLIMRSGSAGMLGSRQFIVTGSDIFDMKLSMFWSGLAAKYVRIHEYGGTIKPKTAKFLRFTIGNQTIFAKQVKIPARLGWLSTWDSFTRENMPRIIDKHRAMIVQRMAQQ